MKTHCWCQMRNPREGRLVEVDDATTVINGIPICSSGCEARYVAFVQSVKPVQLCLDFTGSDLASAR